MLEGCSILCSILAQSNYSCYCCYHVFVYNESMRVCIYYKHYVFHYLVSCYW